MPLAPGAAASDQYLAFSVSTYARTSALYRGDSLAAAVRAVSCTPADQQSAPVGRTLASPGRTSWAYSPPWSGISIRWRTKSTVANPWAAEAARSNGVAGGTGAGPAATAARAIRASDRWGRRRVMSLSYPSWAVPFAPAVVGQNDASAAANRSKLSTSRGPGRLK